MENVQEKISFDVVFKHILEFMEANNYTPVEMINTLACSTAMMSLYSGDPRSYINEITENMRAFVEAKVES